MKVIVTGGAGYIGSRVVRLLEHRGDEVVVVDDLSSGNGRRRSIGQVELIDLSMPDPTGGLDRVFRGADAVVHFAGLKRADESVVHPARYYRQNVGSLACTLEAVERVAPAAIILFSSSAAVYGAVDGAAVTERAPAVPLNPYGATKLAGEQLLEAATDALGSRSASLRYFNAGGAGWPDLAEVGGTNLIPRVIARVQAGRRPQIHGDDHPTPDGTCVRDFVHVMDLAEAHLVALDFLRAERPGHQVFNVGTGRGTSVAQVIAAVSGYAGSTILPEVTPRRPGDPAAVVADVSLIRERMGWTARLGLPEIIASSFA